MPNNEVVSSNFRSTSRGKSSIHTREFMVNNATSIGAAIDAIRAHSDCPDEVQVTNPAGGTYDLTGPEGKPEIEAVELCPGSGVVEARGIWTHPESKRNERSGVKLTDVGDTHYEYIFNGKQVTETYSKDSNGFKSGGTFTADKGINDTPSEGVKGVPINRLKGGIKISKLFGPNEVDGAWVSARKSMVHTKVNSDTFEYAAAKEALLTEFRVVSKESGNWLAEFTIETGDNLTGQTIAGITGVNLNAWDYVEVRYRQEKDATEKVYRSKAFEIIVHEMYGETAYSTLLDAA